MGVINKAVTNGHFAWVNEFENLKQEVKLDQIEWFNSIMFDSSLVLYL